MPVDPTVLTREQRLWLEGWVTAWARAVELQYKRVHPGTGGTFSDGQLDSMMFVVALAKLDLSACALLGEQHAEVQRFRLAVPDSKDVRDMLEHFDEYQVGIGKLQKKEIVKDDFPVHFSRGATSMTVFVAERSVDVETAYDAAMRLHLVSIGGRPDDED